MPAVALASLATGPSRIIRLASGATGAARSAQAGSRPSRRWLRGRRTPCTSCFWCSASDLYVAMSTPVGQSDAQPLQARHRSSASATAGSANPCTSDPSIASWSTRERPAGGVLLVAGGEVRRAHHAGWSTAATHLPTPVQRCTASPSRPPSCGSLSSGSTGWRGPHRPQVGVQRRRVDQVAGVEQVARVADRLDRGEQPDRLRVVHQREQLGARPAVAVLTGERAAVVAQLERAGGEEVAEDLRRADLARLEREVDPHVHAAVAEVAVGHAVEAVPLQQLVEVAQPGAQPVRRDRGVLPAGVRRGLQAAGGQAGAVLADPPERGRLGGVGHQPVPECAAPRPRPGGQRRAPRRRRARRTASRRRSAAPAPRRPAPGPGRRSARPAPRRRPWRRRWPRAARARRRPPRSSTGSRAPPGAARPRPRPAARWPRGPARACPPSRPGTGRRCGRSRAAGARASSRSPGGRTGRTRCARARGAGPPGRRAAPRRRRAPGPQATSSATTLSTVRP